MVEHTPDGRYIVVDGRRWRATDPEIPQEVAAQLRSWATGVADGAYERAVPTTGGCASSWAHGDGQLSTAAVAAQCRTGLEPRFGPYPITLRFAQTHVIQNRADCIRLMSGIAHGEIDPGRAPLFPGGVRP